MRTVSSLLVVSSFVIGCCASAQEVAKPTVARDSSCVPRYPVEAKRSGLQGKVVARVMVEPTGSVSLVELVHTSGSDMLDRAVLEAARCQRFEPGTVDGVPSAMWADYPVNFVLERH